MLPSCLLHPKKAADINVSKRRGSFGFTHGKCDKYMSMVIAAQVLTCLLLLTFPYVRKVENLQLQHCFLQSHKTCLFFLQSNKPNKCNTWANSHLVIQLFPFLFFFFLNLVAHFHLKYKGQLDVGLVGSVLSVYSCVYPFWKEAEILKFLMQSCTIALENVYTSLVFCIYYTFAQ